MDQFHMIFFALGFLLNFQIQAQQNSIALLMVMLHFQQTHIWFRNRPRFQGPGLYCVQQSHFHDRSIPEDYFRQQLRTEKDTFQALLGILGHG